jgi:hypothetical protein
MNIFEYCDIKSNKKTHFGRYMSTDIATFLGIRDEQIARQTKHKLNKLSVYASELDSTMLHVMAKFLPKETYRCPRATIGTPMPVTVLARTLFPYLPQWEEQLSHPGVDIPARHFIMELLPYLAEVCVQDGIYLIEDYPEHAISILLLQRISNYSEWARQKRHDIESMEGNYDADRLLALNEGVRASYNTSVRRTEVFESKSLSRFDSLDTQNGHLLDHMVQLTRQQQNLVRQNNAMASQISTMATQHSALVTQHSAFVQQVSGLLANENRPITTVPPTVLPAAPGAHQPPAVELLPERLRDIVRPPASFYGATRGPQPAGQEVC